MMSSYERFEKLCRTNGVRIEVFEILFEIDPKIIQAWKEEGIEPPDEIRRQIADYLKVSLNYLDTGAGADGLTCLERHIMKLVKQLDADAQYSVAEYANRLIKSKTYSELMN